MKLRLIALALLLTAALVLIVGCSPDQPEVGSDGLHSTIPALVGKPLAEAKADVRAAGYDVGEVTPARASQSGQVSRQDPVAGTSAARGTKVNLVVEDGR